MSQSSNTCRIIFLAKTYRIIFCAAIFIVCTLIMGCGKETANIEDLPTYTINEMMADLEKNPIMASEKYKGKKINVTGCQIYNIKTDSISLAPVGVYATFMCLRVDLNSELKKVMINARNGDKVNMYDIYVYSVDETFGYYAK
ncbi:MAG: hypothetical protein IKN43_03245 [Selenomonadaceae bacterium]|nr:hypothetical protein [Selenomonadaceae bacterium]